MNTEVEASIRQNVSWAKLPSAVKQQLGNSQKEYDKCVVTFSVKNQVRFRGNLIRHVRKDERKYYEDVLEYSRRSLMLFPYHLSDVIIKGLTVAPFQYYLTMIETLMGQEKSYDSLPNFTAADCLRLLGIGRNEYIDLMNQTRSTKKFGFFRKSCRDLLPSKPVEGLTVLPWWLLQVGYVTEDDMKITDKAERALIDNLIDHGGFPAGHADYKTVVDLYRKGLIYFDVPIFESDYVIVPPLEGFVMNRVLGDYFETLLYKIFVSIDENTTVSELASVLEIDVDLVRDAVSLYCRLGFAKKKNSEMDSNDLHPSWYEHLHGSTVAMTISRPRSVSISSEDDDDSLLRELNQELEYESADADDFVRPSKEEVDVAAGAGDATVASSASSNNNNSGASKKIAFLFDSTLTAYLMMGNLSPGLKNHAVTMFEVGKLSDEGLDSLVLELQKVSNVDGEGEAARYFAHAVTLQQTVLFLRQNAAFKTPDLGTNLCLGLDLIRCESLQSLDPGTTTRLLNKNYSLLVSMAPLSNEIRPVTGRLPPHLGPAIPEMSSVWFKMFLYHITGCGPPSLLLAKGTRLRRLPRVFEQCHRLLVTTWGHDPSEIPVSGAITMLLDALQHSPILVQALTKNNGSAEARIKTLAFPCHGNVKEKDHLMSLPQIAKLKAHVDIDNSCGFITLLDFDMDVRGRPGPCHSPKNGKVDAENAQLLHEELDGLAMGEEAQDAEERKKKLSLDLLSSSAAQAKESEKEGNWIILDLSFGIPLFDPDLNTTICERIVSKSLWRKEKLDVLTSSSQKLCHRLLDFISEFRDVAAGDSAMSAPRAKSLLTTDSPFPSKSLFFNGEILEVWHGR